MKLPQITAEDSIDSIVIRFIRDNPNRNEDEIVGALNPLLQMPDKITAALAQLYRAGLVMQSPVLVDGTTLTVYRVKSKVVSDLGRAQEALAVVPPKPFKLPEVAIVDPNGKIIYEQGLDIAIWKMMQDHEWRSIEEIAALLSTYGFQAYSVKIRVKTLHDLGTGGIRWFDTTRKNKQRRTQPMSYYKLRIGVDCPKLGILSIGRGVAEPEDEVLAGDAAVAAIMSGNSVFAAPSQPHAAAVAAQLPKEPVMEQDTQVREGDHFQIVLWKVMVGKKNLLVSDMNELVEVYGFSVGMAASIMSTWMKAGYLDRTEVKKEGGNMMLLSYTLKDMPMPDFKAGGRSKFAVLPSAKERVTLKGAFAALDEKAERALGKAPAAPAAKVADPVKSNPAEGPIQEGDSLMLCIAKLLQGERMASKHDLATVLAVWSFERIPVFDALRYMAKRGFIHQPIGQDFAGPWQLTDGELPAFPVNKGSTPVAKLRVMGKIEDSSDGVAELTARPAVPRRPQMPAAKEVPSGPSIPALILKHGTDEQIAQARLNLQQHAATAAMVPSPPVPLVQHQVIIKGVIFTLTEVDAIVQEMNALKLFDWVAMPNRVVKAKFEIKGLELTPEELNEVLMSMK